METITIFKNINKIKTSKERYEECRFFVEKIVKYLCEPEFKNETGSYVFLDFKEESYEIIKRYDEITIDYHDKLIGYGCVFRFEDFDYRGYEYEVYYDKSTVKINKEKIINQWSSGYTNQLNYLKVLILHIDSFYEAKKLNNELEKYQRKNKFFKI